MLGNDGEPLPEGKSRRGRKSKKYYEQIQKQQQEANNDDEDSDNDENDNNDDDYEDEDRDKDLENEKREKGKRGPKRKSAVAATEEGDIEKQEEDNEEDGNVTLENIDSWQYVDPATQVSRIKISKVF